MLSPCGSHSGSPSYVRVGGLAYVFEEKGELPAMLMAEGQVLGILPSFLDD